MGHTRLDSLPEASRENIAIRENVWCEIDQGWHEPYIYALSILNIDSICIDTKPFLTAKISIKRLSVLVDVPIGNLCHQIEEQIQQNDCSFKSRYIANVATGPLTLLHISFAALKHLPSLRAA